MTEDNKCYKPEPCKDFTDFLVKADDLIKLKEEKRDIWVFKGLRSCEWELETTLERAFKQFNIYKSDDKTRVEARMIREFKRRLHQYTADVPCDDAATDEWLALMQHYGAPTRLLDFTYSPYVAAYFAFEKAAPIYVKRKNHYEPESSYVAIWAVNVSSLNRELKKQHPAIYNNFRRYQKDRNQYFDKVFMQKEIPQLNGESNPPKYTKPRGKFALSANPFRLNDRLAFQRGLFLCPGDITIGFMDNLSECIKKDNLENKVIKYTIPTGESNNITIEALKYLDLMNISRITLFPGLEGFVQSLATRIQPLFMLPDA